MGNVVKNTILVGVSEVASKGIIALAMILLVRTLSPESYGLYSLAITITYFFIGFLHSGFYTIGMREIAKFPDLSEKYLNNITSLKLIMSIISYIILTAIVLFLNKPIEAKIAFLLAGSFLFLLVFHIDWLYRGQDRMEITSIGSVLQGISLLIFIKLFIKHQDDYTIAVIVYLVSWSVYIFFENILLIKENKWLKFELDKNFVKTLLSASLPISFSSLVVSVYANINVLILNIFRGDYETGIYSAMIRLMNILLLPNSILQIAFFPELSRSVLNGTLNKSQRKYLVVLFTIGFFIIFGIYGYSKEIILFVFGKKYLVGDIIFKISLLACFFSYLSASNVIISFALDKQKNFLIATIIGVVVSLGLNLILIPIYGALGAVITLSITELSVFLALVIMNKEPSLVSPYSGIIKPFLVAVLSLVTSKILEMFLNPYFGLSIYVISFIVVAFATKLITYENLKSIIGFWKSS